jgi:hypothetical protein
MMRLGRRVPLSAALHGSRKVAITIAQLGRWIGRHIALIGFLLPLSVIGPVWIYCRFACLAEPPRTELGLLRFAVGVALASGLLNLVPFGIYKGWSRSALPLPSPVQPDPGDPRLLGIIGAGVALFGATAAIHTIVVLDVFMSQPATMSRYALGNIPILIVQFGVMAIGYGAGRVSGALVVVTRRWQRHRNWRRRRDSK